MSFNYAQINQDSICFAVTQTYGLIEQDDMIPIDSYNTSLLGSRWTGKTWESPPEPGMNWDGTKWVTQDI